MITGSFPNLAGYPQTKNVRMGECRKGENDETIRQPRVRLTRQPQEREHRDTAGGTRDRLPPVKGSA
jgi:hypothetical protein